MATGLPVIATDLSGVPELVREGETGYLAKPADHLALADVIEKAYNDPDETARRATNGRQLVLDEFELQNNVKQLSALFQKYISTQSIVANKNELVISG